MAEFECKKFQDEIQKDKEQHEQEIILRLKFEEKLNNLHAINRRQIDMINEKNELLKNREVDYEAGQAKVDEVMQKLAKLRTEKEYLQHWKANSETQVSSRDDIIQNQSAQISKLKEQLIKT